MSPDHSARQLVGWVYHDFFLRHETGDTHPEHPARLEVIVQALAEAGLLSQMAPIAFEPATPQALSCVHEPAYLELIRLACAGGIPFVGPMDTLICPRSYDVALLAAGGVLTACQEAMVGRIRKAFCAIRPPGHHAEPDLASGFCLVNHVAVAAATLTRDHGLRRVAIVDVDVHHGNGTQHIFEQRDDVLYISLHEQPDTLFPGTGFETETGRNQGEGYTMNVALPCGSDGAAYRQEFTAKVLPRLDVFRPEFLLLSMGFDAAREETIAHLALDTEDFGWMTRELALVANTHSEGRLISVLEGGYELGALARSAVAHVAALLD